MIAPDVQPIAHHTPRPRIETSRVWPAPEAADCYTLAAALKREHAERIWSLITSTAQGSNVGEQETAI